MMETRFCTVQIIHVYDMFKSKNYDVLWTSQYALHHSILSCVKDFFDMNVQG